MRCETFRNAPAGEPTAAWLEHLRSCDACLPWAAEADADNLFRAIGGEIAEPPGGIDSFVSGVMQEVRIRQTERVAQFRPRVSRPYRWLAAAAAVVAVAAGSFQLREAFMPVEPVLSPVAVVRPEPVQAPVQLASTRPVIENYQNAAATIVEVPAETADDVKIVMIFDESLPVDL